MFDVRFVGPKLRSHALNTTPSKDLLANFNSEPEILEKKGCQFIHMLQRGQLPQFFHHVHQFGHNLEFILFFLSKTTLEASQRTHFGSILLYVLQAFTASVHQVCTNVGEYSTPVRNKKNLPPFIQTIDKFLWPYLRI
jgi:hypothetical protein